MSVETPTTLDTGHGKKKAAVKLTVSRKILLVVFATTLMGLSLLVFLGLQNQRQDLESLAISNNLTITNLMAEQLSGALKWKKPDKIAEVYQELASHADSVLADVVTFDSEGNVVTEYQSDSLPTVNIAGEFERLKTGLGDSAVYSEMTGTHQIILTPVITPKDELVGYAAVTWSLNRLNDRLSANLMQQLLLTGAALLGIMLLTGFLLNRFIGKPLSQLTGAMTSLANGQQDITIVGLDRKDDVGDMSRAVQVFQANAEKMRALEIQREKDAEEKAVEADTRRQAEMQRAEEEKRRDQEAADKSTAERISFAQAIAQKLESSVNAVAQQISGAAATMEEKAKSMVTSAADTDRHSTAIAAASEQAAGNVSGVASAAEELSASLQEISRQVDVSAKQGLRRRRLRGQGPCRPDHQRDGTDHQPDRRHAECHHQGRRGG